MRIEHVAFNIPEPDAAAEWYVRHLGLRVVKANPGPPVMRFLAGDAGPSGGMIELYHNPRAPLPDYRSMDPLMLHVALVVDDIDAERARLLAAGAQDAGAIQTNASGDQLVFLRDPWGLALQLVKRREPMR